MVQALPGITTAGLAIESREYNVQANRYKTRQQVFGNDIDFKSNLFMSGTDGDAVLSKIGRDLNADLSWGRYITDNNDNNDIVFQSGNGGEYTNINFGKGYYTKMNELQFAYSTGAFGSDQNYLAKNKPYDLVVFGQDQAQFVDYKFSGFADGQSTTVIPFSNYDNTRWGKNVSYVSQEFNPFAVDYNPYSTGEAGIANNIYNQICAQAPQWMTYSEATALGQYQQGSANYNNFLMQLIVTKFDQGNELSKWYGNL